MILCLHFEKKSRTCMLKMVSLHLVTKHKKKSSFFHPNQYCFPLLGMNMLNDSLGDNFRGLHQCIENHTHCSNFFFEVITRQNGLQNNWLPKVPNAKLVELTQGQNSGFSRFTSYYFPQNGRALWVHPSKIILNPRFAKTKIY